MNLLFVTNAQSNIEKATAYFYQFKTNSCLMSFDGYGSTNDCSNGIISIAVDDTSSVNVSLISKLGAWQLVLSEGDTSQPRIEVIVIRSTENINTKQQIAFTKDDGDIVRGLVHQLKSFKEPVLVVKFY
ncbi:hypothetical protein NON20_25660 (plasmid) [Synechocystis sp. B12]|nr:hypothetical protein NON20_25660 [Synechocystis sp. B12]